MKVVQPIRNMETLSNILGYLKSVRERDYIMCMIGINTGLRISDILQLRVKDVRGKYINIREKKKKKVNRILITPNLRRALDVYISGKLDDEFLMVSRKGNNKPIRRETAYKIIKGACLEFGVKEVGTHTLRKTFGYHYYLETKDLAMLQDLLNHTDDEYTLRYIGINQDGRDFAMKKIGSIFPSM